MRWYKHLYVGERAKRRRFAIIQGIRKHRLLPGVHVITPASGSSNLLDILPAAVLLQDYYRKQEDLLILGIAADYFDALLLAGTMVAELYRKTGGFDRNEFLFMNGQR